MSFIMYSNMCSVIAILIASRPNHCGVDSRAEIKNTLNMF